MQRRSSDVVGGVDHDLALQRGGERRHGRGHGRARDGEHHDLGIAHSVGDCGEPGGRAQFGGERTRAPAVRIAGAEDEAWPAAAHLRASVPPMLP